MQIDPDAVTWCTQTVNGLDPSYGSGFFSCSHCTADIGVVDSTKVYQPHTDGTGEYIGLEVRDAPLFTGDPCPTGRRCAWADVAYFAHTHSGIGEFGTIAHPTAVCTANCSDNETALTISTTDPRWYVWSDYTGSIVDGIGLQKVGARTGWTYGQVTNTCYDWNDPSSDITRLCQVRTNGIADGGDSGSPVFRFVAGAGPNKISLYGILFAGNPTTPTFIFSPWTRVIQYFGPIATHNEPPSVYISGPTLIQDAGTYTWQANPSGGNGSYAYQWYVHYFINGNTDPLGTSQTQDLYVDAFCDFEMQVQVTSGSEIGSNTLYVTNQVGGACGPERPIQASPRRAP
jgi:hypothetical protein